MDFSLINKDNYNELLDYMRTLADERYKAFHSGLVPDTDNIMGIRVPVLRTLAKEIAKGDCEGFLQTCGRTYYEEDLLRGIVIANIKADYDELVRRVDGFIPYVNNWAVCDTFCTSLKQVKKHKPQFFDHIEAYLSDGNMWSKRVGLILMLCYYIEEDYIDEVLKRCERTISEEYYVMMGRAWLIATAYAKFPDKTKEFLLGSDLDDVTFNKAIQKCIESSRISGEDKAYLRTLKRR